MKLLKLLDNPLISLIICVIITIIIYTLYNNIKSPYTDINIEKGIVNNIDKIIVI